MAKSSGDRAARCIDCSERVDIEDWHRQRHRCSTCIYIEVESRARPGEDHYLRDFDRDLGDN